MKQKRESEKAGCIGQLTGWLISSFLSSPVSPVAVLEAQDSGQPSAQPSVTQAQGPALDCSPSAGGRGRRWEQLGQVPEMWQTGQREPMSLASAHTRVSALREPYSFQRPPPTAPPPPAGRKPRHPALPRALAPPPGSCSCTLQYLGWPG